MASAEEEHTCRFQWTIENPFLPFRERQAIFFHGSPTATQWKVTLQPLPSYVNFKAFLLLIDFDEWFGRPNEITADNMSVRIILNGEYLVNIEGFHHTFNSVNQYQYHLETYGTMYPFLATNRLIIEIRMSLPDPLAVNQVPNELVFNENDLTRLSEDLGRLNFMQDLSNIELKSGRINESTHVHSYILDARWDNFFQVHNFHPVTDTAVETCISFQLLLHILLYMYTGQITGFWEGWRSIPYPSELFQVIRRYKLYHLYAAFVPRDMNQLRETLNSSFVRSCTLPMEILDGLRRSAASLKFPIIERGGYDLIFETDVQNHDGPWLSYSLTSKSSFRVFAQVYLEVLRCVQSQGYAFQRAMLLHECCHRLESKGYASSRHVVFLGCPETFGTPARRPGERRDTPIWIRFVLKFSDGTSIEQVRSFDGEMRQPLESLSLLSDHMHRLRVSKTGADLQVVSRSSTLGIEHRENVHKGILEARMRNWREVFLSEPQGAVETVRCTLPSEALFHVLNYVYTGKVTTLPRLFLDEIQQFAIQSGCGILLDVVSHFRTLI